MSAANWTTCPRCVKRRDKQLERAVDRIAKAYGRVSIAEFDIMRNEVAKTPVLGQTFREDYEIWGADGGTVHVSYKGQCMMCGISFQFEHEAEVALDE